jgi:hypothetical protein
MQVAADWTRHVGPPLVRHVEHFIRRTADMRPRDAPVEPEPQFPSMRMGKQRAIQVSSPAMGGPDAAEGLRASMEVVGLEDDSAAHLQRPTDQAANSNMVKASAKQSPIMTAHS